MFEIRRYFDDYTDGIVWVFETEEMAKAELKKLEDKNRKPYTNYEIKPC